MCTLSFRLYYHDGKKRIALNFSRSRVYLVSKYKSRNVKSWDLAKTSRPFGVV